MQKVLVGTSWQSKASMPAPAILIAQRLQIETLRGGALAYKSCRKTQQQLHIRGFLAAYRQREVHPCGAVGFDRSRHIQQGERYFLVRLTVENIERAGGERIIVHLRGWTRILEDQDCGGLRG